MNFVYWLSYQQVGMNLFRPLPPRTNPTGPAFDPEEDDPTIEEGIVLIYTARVVSSFAHLKFVNNQ